MIYALDIVLLVASYVLGSILVIMNGSIQPHFEKYGVKKTAAVRALATLALNVPVLVYFPVVFAAIATLQVACQVWYYRDLKKTYSEWSRV